MKSRLAYMLGLCAVSVSLCVSEPVDARSKRGARGMGHGPVVSQRGYTGHRQVFRSGVTLPRDFRSGVTLPRDFRSGVTLPRDFRSGVTLQRSAQRGTSRPRNRVSRSAGVGRHEGKRRSVASSSSRRMRKHVRGDQEYKAKTEYDATRRYSAEISHEVAERSVKRKSHEAAKPYRGDKPHKARRKRYQVVDWKPADRRYRDTSFASAAKKHSGHERHRGKKQHYKAEKHAKHGRHTHLSHLHHRRAFSAGVYYAVPRTEVFVVNAYEEYDDCRRLIELGHDASGRAARVEWTLCFDEYGEPYIPEDGRHVVTLY